VKKADFKILIVEDDNTLGWAIEEALKRAGYSVTLCRNVDAAESALRLQEYHGLIVDCMLPKKNGVDLAQEIRKRLGEKLIVVLTSGVFKDKAFAKNAMASTGAVEFLFKPFDLDALLGIFEGHFKDVGESEGLAIHNLFSYEHLSANDRLIALHSTQFAHGFDLPWIFCLLSHPQISFR
jgi:DNA-binding response OmpR family regulator